MSKAEGAERPESPNDTDPSQSMTLCRRVVTFFVAMAASTTAFNLYSFVVYLNDVKSYFHLTQSQVEMIISMNYLGMTSTLPAGFIIGRYGIKAGAGVALAIPPVAYSLIYSATRHVEFYHDHVSLLVLYFFLAGCGSGVTYLVAVTAATPIFPPSRRGTVIALVTSGTNIGALLFMLLYTKIFEHGAEEGRQNLSGFFGLVGIMFSVFNLCGLLIYKEAGPKEKGYSLLNSKSDSETKLKISSENIETQLKARTSTHTEATTLLEEKAMQKYGISLEDLKVQKVSTTDIESGYLGSSETGSSDKSEDQESVSPASSSDQLHDEDQANRAISCRDLLREPVFHLLGWACIITIGLVSMDLNNLLVFTDSLEMSQYATVLPYLAVVLGLIGKMSIGYISDITVHRIQRAMYIFVMGIVNTCMYVLCIFALGNAFILVINPILITTGSVVMFSLTPTILSEYFGTRSFAKCWGIIYFGTAVSGFFFQNMLGWFYDLYVQAGSTTHTCYGEQCFRYSFTVAAAMTGLSTLLVGMFLIYNRKRQNK